MACLFIEGFDKYGPPAVSATRLADLLAGEWNVVSIASSGIVGSLTAYGYSMFIAGNASLTKSFGNKSRLIVGVRCQPILAAQVQYIAFGDSGTTQCSIAINSSGNIVLHNGTTSGSTIATSAVTISSNSTHYLEADITFGNSAAYNIYLDGVSILSGTGDTTTTANNTANSVAFGAVVTNSGWSIDDIYIFDTTGSFCNAVLNTNPVVDTQLPTVDHAVQFAPTSTVIGQAESYTGGAAISTGANTIYLVPITPSENLTLNSVSLMPAASNGAAKYRSVLYTGASVPTGAPVATGSEVVGATSGTELSLPFGSGQALTSGTKYWVGYFTDTAVNVVKADTHASGYTASFTYAATGPTTPSMSSGQNTRQMWGVCTGAAASYPTVGLTDANGVGAVDENYLTDSTVGHEDLYGFPNLNITPTGVYVVAIKAFMRDTDSGARTVTMQAKSVATDTASTAFTPATTYGWASGYYETDPNTSAAWAGAAVNAGFYGYAIAT